MSKGKHIDYEIYRKVVLDAIPSQPCGKHHKEIAYEVGLTPVQVRTVIKMLRFVGHPICSNPIDGYWIARNDEEIQDVIDMFEGYIASMRTTVKALYRAKSK